MWPKWRAETAGPVGSKGTVRSRLVLLGLAVVPLVLSGCIRLDMYNQPRYEPYEVSRFYPEGSSARTLVPGTVARGWLQADRAYVTGSLNDSTFVDELPFALTEEVLRRGRERYGIYCAVCHDEAGTGRGMVVRRGYKQPPSYHIDRLRQEKLGYFFDVITRGFATMPSYAVQIPTEDRWAIVAWIRVLQRAQYVDLAVLPESVRQEIATAATKGTVVGLPGEATTHDAHGAEQESHD